MGKQECRSNKFNLPQDKIAAAFRQPYILGGYRSLSLTCGDCIRSAFVECNETWNIWTHLAAFCLFVWIYACDLWEQDDVTDPLVWPLLLSDLGRCLHFLSSFLAHMFCAMSPKTYHFCFFMDYASVSVMSYPAGLAFLFYMRPLQPEVWLFKFPMLFGLFSICVSVLTTVLVCLSRVRWYDYRYFIRSFTFVVPFIVYTSPLLCRIIFCSSDVDCNYPSARLFWSHVVMYLLAAIVTASRFPERVFPGTFDNMGHSHNVMHVLTTIAAYLQHRVVQSELQARREHFQVLRHAITVWNSLVLFALACFVNIAVAVYFGRTLNVVDKEIESKKD